MWHHPEKLILVDVSPWLQASGIWDERKVKGREEGEGEERDREHVHVRWIGLRSGLVRLDLVDGLLAWADALLRVESARAPGHPEASIPEL